jgi:hypothetical protein
MGMIGTPDDDGLAFRSIVRDDGDDDDDRDDEDGDDDREHGGDIASRPSISAIRLPGSTNSSSSRLFSPPAPLPSLITTRAMASASGEHWPAGDVTGVIFGGWVGCGGSCQAPVCQMLHIGKMTMPQRLGHYWFLAMLVFANANIAEAKHIKVFRHSTCSEQVGSYSTGVADCSIGGGDNMCYFVSNSEVGRRILKTCPIGTDCHVVGTVENDQDAGDWSPIITEVSEVGRNNDAKQAKVRHDRPCDAAQDHPEKFNFNPGMETRSCLVAAER